MFSKRKKSDAGHKTEQPAVVGTIKKSRLKNRKVAKPILAVILIGALGYLGYTTYLNNFGLANCSDRSEGSILLRANDAMTIRYFTQGIRPLEGITKEIQSKRGYKKEPNCMYPLVRYAQLKNDPELAKEYFDQFEAAYGDGSTFAKDVYKLEDITLLKQQIEFAYEANKKYPPVQGSYMTFPEKLENPGQ